MAKYKFSRTIKPGQGIVIDAEGVVSEYKTEPVAPAAHVIIEPRIDPSARKTHFVRKPVRASAPRQPTDEGRFPFGWELKLKQSSVPGKGTRALSRKTQVKARPMSVKPSSQPHVVATISMDNPLSPYHGCARTVKPPAARAGGGMFGVFAPKPVSRSAAMSFQTQHEELRR